MAITCSLQDFLTKVDVDSEDVKVDKSEHYDYMCAGYTQFGGTDSADLTWRLGRSCFKRAAAAEVAGDQKQVQRWLQDAEDKCRQAVDLDAGCALAHVWLATVVGKRCDFLSAKERIAAGKEVQSHLDTALEIQKQAKDESAEDFIARYTYGRWCYEVASLSWMERKIATVMFGTPPEATFEDAMSHFREVERQKPDWKANLCWISKTAVCLKDYATAIQMADKAHEVPAVDEEDLVSEKEIASIRKKYSSYRKTA